MNTEQEFTDIYHAYAPKVHRLCLGYASGNYDLASEWLQETFIKVWTHRNSFDGKSAIGTWIYRIAVNVCLGDLRKSPKRIPMDEHTLTNCTSDDDRNDEEINIKKMYRCIDQLNAQNKTLIFLELENIPQATIADTIGLKPGTLRTRLSRIRKLLLKCIKNGK